MILRTLIQRLAAPFAWHRLHAGVKALFFVQIVNRMGDFVVPFLTLILTQVQGMAPAQAGLVVTLATGLGSLGGLLAGKLSDGRSRRNVLVVFLGISGSLLAIAGFAPARSEAAVAMVISGFFLGGMRPILGALVADLTDGETRRAAFSLSYLGVNIGTALGPLLAGWLFGHAMRWLFWLDALSTACALGILVRFVPRHTAQPVADTPEHGTSANSLEAFLRHRVLLPFGVLLGLYHFVYAQMIFTLALQLVDLFGAGGPSAYGLVWAVNSLTVVAFTPVAMRLTRAWSNLRSMAWAMALFALGIAVFLFRPSLAWVLASTLMWSCGEVLISIHVGDLVGSQTPSEVQGRFQGYVNFLGSLGFVVAPVTGGLVAQSLGLTGVWWLATVLLVGTGIGFAMVDRRAKPAMGLDAAVSSSETSAL